MPILSQNHIARSVQNIMIYTIYTFGQQINRNFIIFQRIIPKKTNMTNKVSKIIVIFVI